MKLERIESPFVFEVTNDTGVKCLMDASQEIGGKNKGFRPMELLAASLAGCISIDVLHILKKQRKEPENFSINIETKRKPGELAPFELITLEFALEKDQEEENFSKIVALVLEKYCSVAASLNDEIRIELKFKKVDHGK